MKININFFEFFNLPMNIMCVISIVTGSLLFLPEKLLEKLGTLPLTSKIGFVVGLFFLLSTAMVIVSIVTTAKKRLSDHLFNKRIIKKAPKRIQKLSRRQKAIVALLYTSYNHTAELPLKDGDVSILHERYFIVQVGSFNAVELINPTFPYTLQPWVTFCIDNDSEVKGLLDKDVEFFLTKELAKEDWIRNWVTIPGESSNQSNYGLYNNWY